MNEDFNKFHNKNKSYIYINNFNVNQFIYNNLFQLYLKIWNNNNEDERLNLYDENNKNNNKKILFMKCIKKKD